MSDNRNPNLGLLSHAGKTDAQDWRRNLGRSRIDLTFPRTAAWWTGKAPTQGKIHSLNIPNLSTCTRQEVLDYFDNGWMLTEVVFSSLIGEEAFYRPPYHGLRHPLAFYYVHPVALYVNKLLVAGLIEKPVNPYYERLFETGVDEMSWDDMSKNNIEWPAIDDLWNYRRKVYELVVNVINTHPGLLDGHAPITSESPLWALFMGFEHERIHLETSAFLVRELPIELVKPPTQWPELSSVAGEDVTIHNQFVDVPQGLVEFGKPRNWPTYGWDNEYGMRTVSVAEFKTTSYLISNAEFWQFVVDGGYSNQKYWSEAGWHWRNFRNVKWPTFWYQDGPAGSNQFKLRTTFEIIPMQWTWPAIVNHHEAKAYCTWLSERNRVSVPYRLITEAEHQRLRQVVAVRNDERNLVVPEPYNLNLRHGSESPVNETESGSGLADVFGNVWQWCEDDFNPLPGFKVHKYYDDFSSPCFDGEHNIILGGSFVSTGDEATPWARFHFRPHFFQNAGFRIAYSLDGGNGQAMHVKNSDTAVNQYETEMLLDQYMLLHYGDAEDQMPYTGGPKNSLGFPARCAELICQWNKKLDLPFEQALDVGCAVGGSSFKLADSFRYVEAIDLSEAFINAAKDLQKEGQFSYRIREEGDIYRQAKAAIPEGDGKERGTVNFRRADACALPPEYVDFDAVLIANVLCRLPSPMALLSRLSGERGIVKKGGLVMFTTPYTWMEQFTPKDVWLGGFVDDNGNAQWSENGLKMVLSPAFELVHREDMPLIIREHKRKYQYIVALATIWRRFR